MGKLLYARGDEFLRKVSILIYVSAILFMAVLLAGWLTQRIEPVVAQSSDYTTDGQVFTKGETWTFRTPPVTGAIYYLIAFHKASAPGWFYENYAHDRQWSYDGSWTIAPTHPFYSSFVAGEDVRVEFRPYTASGWGAQKFVTVKIAGSNPVTTGDVVLTGTIAGESGLSTPGGKIINQPNGLNCPTLCAIVYRQAGSAPVTLQAVPNPGYKFTEWVSGGCIGSNTSATCDVLLDKSKTMTASFVKDTSTTTPPLTVSLDPSMPVPSSVAPGATNVEVLRLRLTASAGGDVTVDSLTVQKTGLSICPFTGPLLKDVSTGTRLGGFESFGANCLFVFSSLNYVVPRASTRSAAVYVNVMPDAMVGQTFAFQLSSATASAPVSGLPVNGPVMTIGGTTLHPFITVLSPNGGETWLKGTTQTIKWQDNTPIPLCPIGAACPSSEPKYYDIRLVPYSPPCTGITCTTIGVAPYTIAKNAPGFSYHWPVGKYIDVYGTGGGIVPDGSYTIQICQTGSTTCDFSDSYFKITSQISTNTPPKITGVTAPTNLQVGESSQFGFAAVDPDRDDLAWSVSWGDGNQGAAACPLPPPQGEGKGRGYTTRHVWNAPGTYRVSVYVTDCHGGEDRDAFTVVVGGSGRRIVIWQGLGWTPIDVGEGVPDDGTWYTFGEELRQDGVTDRHYKVVATSMASLSDYEVKAVVRLRAGSEVALCGRMDDNGNGYCFVTHWGGGNNTMIAHLSNNDQNPGDIAPGKEFIVHPNTDYVMKLRFEGNKIKGKIYSLDNGSAPEEDWTAEATDTRYTSGKVGLYSYGSRPVFTYLALAAQSEPPRSVPAEPIPNPIPSIRDESVERMERRASLLRDDRLDAILSELKLLRNLVQEQQTEIKYLKTLTQDLTIRSSQAEAAIKSFITYGVDENTKRLGAGERAAVMHSYKAAFDKLPETEEELADAIKIANGRWPSAESVEAEARASTEFKKVYQRDPNLKNPNDDAAVTVMAYGLRQRAENRNLKSEAKGILTFKNLYRRPPQSTEDWNIVQAITYSGAKR